MIDSRMSKLAAGHSPPRPVAAPGKRAAQTAAGVTRMAARPLRTPCQPWPPLVRRRAARARPPEPGRHGGVAEAPKAGGHDREKQS